MMIPPSFSDLGKSTRDLFDKKFKFGFITIDHSSLTSDKFELNLSGENEIKAGKLNGHFETKHRLSDMFKLNTKFDTKNNMTLDIVETATYLPGHSKTLSINFMPHKEESVIKLKQSYKRAYFNGTLDLETKPENKCLGAPSVTATAVVGGCPSQRYDGFYLGGEVNYDCNTKALKKHQLRAGYQKGKLGVVANMLNTTEYQALIYQKVKPNLQVGVKFTWNKESKESNFGVASQYNFESDNNSFIKAKLDNASLLGLAYGFKLHDGVSMHLSTQIDGKRLEGGNHQVGMGIDFSL